MKTSVRSAVTLWLTACLIGGVAAIVPARVATAQEAAAECADELSLEMPVGEDAGKVPGLLVHGRGSKPSIWETGESPMRDVLQSEEFDVVKPFDYESESTKWVANSDAAHRLAETIVCYYLLYGEKVVVGAHSMGGLLTYETLGGWAAYGIYVSDAVGTSSRSVRRLRGRGLRLLASRQLWHSVSSWE